MREIFQSNAVVQDVSDEARLAAWLDQSEALLCTLSDPDYPDIGHDFMERLHATGCAEEAYVRMFNDVAAVYAPFDPNEQASFINLIKYNMVADEYGPRSAVSILRSRMHDGGHAIAWNNAAILHATPFNNAARVIMCPASFLIASDLVERDTYVKTVWQGSLIGEKYPEFHDFTTRDPLSSREFASIREQHDGALLPAMIGAATIVLAKSHHLHATYADHYHALALRDYERQMDYLRATNREFEFVRIGAQDVEDIGRTYGPNIFRDQAYFTQLPELSPYNRATLQRLQTKYGTGAHVPEFGAMVNPVAFLETSKNQGQSVAMNNVSRLVAA